MHFKSLFTKASRQQVILIDPKLNSELKHERMVEEIQSMKSDMEKGKQECIGMNIKLNKIIQELKLLKQSIQSQEMRLDLNEHKQRRSII